MMYYDAGIEMETIMGDGSRVGFFGKILGIGRRLLTDESLFMTVFQNKDSGKKRAAFAAPYPGKIIPIKLCDIGGTLICQEGSVHLCCQGCQHRHASAQKSIGAGFFGGEGFMLQKLEGNGFAFARRRQSIRERELAEGQEIRVDTGCIVGYTPTVDFDVKFVGGIKSMFFGGEGIFLSRLRDQESLAAVIAIQPSLPTAS